MKRTKIMSCVSLSVVVCVMGSAPFFLHVSMVSRGTDPVKPTGCVVRHLCEPEDIAVETGGLHAFNQLTSAPFPAFPVPRSGHQLECHRGTRRPGLLQGEGAHTGQPQLGDEVFEIVVDERLGVDGCANFVVNSGLQNEVKGPPDFVSSHTDGFLVVLGSCFHVEPDPVNDMHHAFQPIGEHPGRMDADFETEICGGLSGRDDRLLAQCLSTCEDDAVEQPPPARQQVFDVAPRDCAGDRRVEDRRILAVGAAQGAALAEDRRDEAPGPVDGGQRDEPGHLKVMLGHAFTLSFSVKHVLSAYSPFFPMLNDCTGLK
nr:MAG TPA: hypothetical protein [Caudoviricetes sp.]